MDEIDSLFLAYKIIKKRLILNIILVIQLLLCMALLFTLICEIQFNLLANKIFNYTSINNAYYLYHFDQYLTENETSMKISNKVLDKLNSIEEITDIGDMKYYACNYKSKNINDNTNCYIYNKVLIDNMKCLLKEGIWFTEYDSNSTEKVIPLIACENMGVNLNDIIDINFPGRGRDISERKTYKGVVIGILNELNYLYDFGSGGTQIGLDSLIKKKNKIFILPEYYLDKSDIKDASDSLGRMLFVSNKSLDVKKKLTDLSIGIVKDTKDMSIVTAKEYKRLLFINGLVLIVFSLITMAGIGGNNGLQRLTNEKNFSIYYMTGLSWRNCIHIELWRTIIIIGVPYIIFIFLYLTNNLGQFYKPEVSVVNIYTFIAIFLYITLIYITTSLSSVLSLAKSNPVDVIRRWE